MRKFIMSLTTVASLSLAAVPVLGLTQAANAAEANIRVPYGDLNLANPAQAAIFSARVDTAGKDLCRTMLRKGQMTLPMRGCVAEVRREVEREMSPEMRKAVAQAAQSHELAAR
ncbi:UrcA family protein [Caulobacter segnis]|jgi:UrcA family protein|uniref:UrcA family protein n=1 Tax=Caulobacter segnis TaxID=88688 RepID=UPI001CBE014B|nr:UrcA family protein [Caulobacter segnis]UAL11265.1 UrcA family protein [Caulobacter segnis]